MFSIVIPIYNEADNIIKLSDSILKALSNLEYEVLFINDGSTDDSENIIEKITQKIQIFV